MWCDQAKSVWSRSNSLFSFLTTCLHHSYSYILQKTPLKLVSFFQRYEQLKDAKNNRKQKTFSSLFGSILKSIFPTSDWFCLITSHMWYLDLSNFIRLVCGRVVLSKVERRTQNCQKVAKITKVVEILPKSWRISLPSCMFYIHRVNPNSHHRT